MEQELKENCDKQFLINKMAMLLAGFFYDDNRLDMSDSKERYIGFSKSCFMDKAKAALAAIQEDYVLVKKMSAKIHDKNHIIINKKDIVG